MAFLSSENKDIAQPMELSLFASPTNQVAVEKVYFTEARPISSIGASDTPIEIVVSGAGAEYIDFKRSRLYAKASCQSEDNQKGKGKHGYRKRVVGNKIPTTIFSTHYDINLWKYAKWKDTFH